MPEIKKPWDYGNLVVGKDKRYLYNGTKPFFWLADTGWLMFQRLTLKETDQYLHNRKTKGFNVIQTMILHRLPLVNKKGDKPFLDDIICHVDDRADGYWEHIDSVLDLAEKYGLYLAMVPAWGDIVKCGLLNENNVDEYIEFLAERYGQRKNVIWIVGGDLLGSVGIDVWKRMGSLLRKKCPDQLITFHPVTGTTSSIWFQNEEWLDFNMFQSGHSTYEQVKKNNPAFISDEQLPYAEDNWRYIEHDYALIPEKPTLDAEPSYENIMKGLKNWGVSHWKAKDVRRYLYWSVLAGGLGITYGHNAIMQMYYDGAGPGSFGVTEYWYEAIHHEGSCQAGYIKKIMDQLPFTTGKEAQEKVYESCRERYERIAVFAGTSFLLAYTYTGRKIIVKAHALDNLLLDAFWMNPENGDISYIRECTLSQDEEFEPIIRNENSNDWLLLLVDKEKNYI